MKIIRKKKHIIMINMFLLFLAVLVFFALTAETAQDPPPFENYNTEQQKGRVGSNENDNAKTKQLFSSFVDGKTIYVVWTGIEQPDVYYSYYPARDPATGGWTANGWSDAKVLVSSANYAKLGVEPVIFTPETGEKQVCLFMKSAGDHPIMHYTCTSDYVGSNNGSEPNFSWQDFIRVPMRGDTVAAYEEIDGIASTKHKESDPHAFYFMQSQLWTGTSGKPNDYYVEISRVTSQETTTDNPRYLNFERMEDKIKKLSSPTLFLSPDALNLSWPFYTFYNHTKYDRTIYYAGGDQDSVPAELFDHDGYKLSTTQRAFNYHFKNNIYVVFKAETNEKVYFTQINELDFAEETNDGKNGWKKWRHCKFFLGTTTDAARTPVGPALFEYNDALYILYADHLSDNRISYIRIDNIRNAYGYLSEDTPYHCGMGY